MTCGDGETNFFPNWKVTGIELVIVLKWNLTTKKTINSDSLFWDLVCFFVSTDAIYAEQLVRSILKESPLRWVDSNKKTSLESNTFY